MDRRDVLGALGTGAVVGITGCLGSATIDDGRDVTDLVGRTVTVPTDVDRLVALEAGCLRLVAQLDATDLIVGVEDDETGWLQEVPYNAANPELATKPVIGGRGGDPEGIIDAAPDLVLSTGSAEELETLERRTGLPVFGLTTGQFLDLGEPTLEEIWEAAGDVLGKEERANELSTFVEDTVADLRDRTATADTDDAPSAYVTGVSFQGGHGLEATRPLFAPFDFLGDVKNVASDVGFDGYPHVTISPEQLLAWDPDVIFVDRGNADLIEADLTETAYQELTAVESGELYGMLPNAHYGLNHSTIVANAYVVGSVLYPEAFDDVEIDQRADEIYDTMLGEPMYDDLTSTYGDVGRMGLTSNA
ncbi:ABC transporter substrate-binding protein [Natronobacterium gregoryi]|uniref:ABC transporter substrate-binding protein n=2 Tax=Natronobacterium gregoryi TaxID=44930 RepID=L0AGM1_NATGS|nr:ABC transporter substrate-binding protein [Natronobacterium gregoryi]AFZ72215.1 ABC-type Fe3+-hydroxamate transport system, periplasmic component [Natronobacterium gregoryi SP2]ELY62385.1 periplasmic binding protein [Natronobacterium gregoryi SP2]PLK20165.1 ABC transporter substrate-binding protein [Natronobacterium gregoryi SP2]SFJ28267.1 iron complex transport system substrate-binding protein [Natronobacterium gregoryi]